MHGGLHVEVEAELEVLSGDGTALQLADVHALGGELGQEAVEGPGPVAGGGHEGDPVGPLENFQIFGNADEAGVVVVRVGDPVRENVQAVEVRTACRGDGGDVRAIALGDVLGGGGVVAEDGDLHAADLEELAALVEGLLVGHHLFDIGELRAGLCKQAVLDLQLQTAHDLAVVLLHEVVDLGDGTGGAVLDGQDAVAAHPGLHGAEDAVEAVEVHDLGQGEQLVAGHLGVSALHALTCHHGPAGEGPGVLRRRENFPAELRLLRVQAVLLVVPAQLQQGGVEELGVLLQLLAAETCHAVENFTLPAGGQDGGVVLLLVVRDGFDRLHALFEEGHQLPVDPVQLVPVVFQFHF